MYTDFSKRQEGSPLALLLALLIIELEQPRRRRQQEPHKFEYFTELRVN